MWKVRRSWTGTPRNFEPASRSFMIQPTSYPIISSRTQLPRFTFWTRTRSFAISEQSTTNTRTEPPAYGRRRLPIWWKQLRRFWQKNRSPLNTPKQSVAPLDALKKKSSPMGKSLFTRMCFPYYKTIARFVIVREMWLRFRYSLLRMR